LRGVSGSPKITGVNPQDLCPCDIAAFMAHPDDMELSCGGTMALAVRQGWKAGAVDFTRSELSTRGTPEVRARETEAASKVIGLSCRINLGIPDGRIRDTDEAREAVVRAIRRMRPKVVIAPPLEDHHADHMAVAAILVRAVYLAGVAKYAPGDDPWRPHALLHTIGSRPAVPSLIVDVTSVYETRAKAILCYRSQFHDEASTEPATRISHPEFLKAIEGAARRNGAFIGVPFGEAFTVREPIPVADPVALYSRKPWEHAPKGN
jgi:bacillithiol biosynthesis deacetylase BshB1